MRKLLFFLALVFSHTLAVAESRSGEQLYNTFCAACHLSGIANAPKVKDPAAWAAKKKSLNEFVASAKAGLNVMPPYGLCTDCSDDELKAAIEYMMKK